MSGPLRHHTLTNSRRPCLLYFTSRDFSWWRNSSNTSQKTLDKISRKMEQENKQNEAFDKLSRSMQKDQPYFNQSLFYGHQMNQFPKRQNKVKEVMQEEIERQRSQVLKNDEYEKVQQQFKDKGVKRVPFFIASENTMRTHFTLVSFGRLIGLFNLGYVVLSGLNLSFGLLGQPQLLYLCTAGMTVMNGLYAFYMRRVRKTYVIRIEWDVPSEQFVIVKPKGITGESHQLVPVSDLVMNSKSKERDCIYFNQGTGEGLATVNRGQWYNMMLFMHLMQRNVKVKDNKVMLESDQLKEEVF